jgi:hypothetical protein
MKQGPINATHDLTNVIQHDRPFWRAEDLAEVLGDVFLFDGGG